MGQRIPSHQWDRRRRSLFLLTPIQARGTNINLKVLHERLLLYRYAIETRVWVKVEVEDRVHGPRHQEPRGMSTPSHHILSQLISQ